MSYGCPSESSTIKPVKLRTLSGQKAGYFFREYEALERLEIIAFK
jgi:hypothetical protein